MIVMQYCNAVNELLLFLWGHKDGIYYSTKAEGVASRWRSAQAKSVPYRGFL